MSSENPFEIVARLETSIGLSSGFFKKLQEEDDWTHVVKLHALLEAALSHVIVHRLDCDALGPPISRLEMSDKDKGKVAFASALGLIEAADRAFIILLSQLRNKCVHDVRQAEEFSLAKTCAAMDASQKNNFVKAVWIDEETRASVKGKLLSSPRIFLHLGALRVLAVLCMRKETETLRRQYDEMVKQGYDELVKQREEETGRSALHDALLIARARQEQEQSGGQDKEA
ncbi:hypothetical protein [Cupriavidus necator]|uniref:Uncharacterized protein n=1 Tax=Cupriavidus pinatubonensis (strain JMP 134 / LMG 1197) TaxID=264198 RepID=Q46W09_CUPPJ|nr:hypothetical protein [Cupriavidus necator]